MTKANRRTYRYDRPIRTKIRRTENPGSSIKLVYWSKSFLWNLRNVVLCYVHSALVRLNHNKNYEKMKKIISNVSPFLLLVIPIFVILLWVAGQTGREVIQDRIHLNASFISLPDTGVFKVLFW